MMLDCGTSWLRRAFRSAQSIGAAGAEAVAAAADAGAAVEVIVNAASELLQHSAKRITERHYGGVRELKPVG